MTRVSRFTVGALISAAVLLPFAPAQAETVPQPAAQVADGGTGSSMQSITCTILKLIMLNQGPSTC